MTSDLIYVRAHYRRRCYQFTPRWAALLWEDGAWWVWRGKNYWTQDLSRAKLFLKNYLKREFKERIADGTVVLVRVK